jgi:hypothetical protein
MLVMTLLARDEEDIVDANLRYHLDCGVDFVIATDNRSEDGTRAVLERYAREGHLRLLLEDRDSYPQAQAVTHMARMAAEEHGANWVINNDADEFWWPREGTLKELFAAIWDDYGALAASRTNFVARPDEGGFFAERMIVSKVRELSAVRDRAATKYHFDRYAQYAMPKVAHRGRRDIEVANGSHSVVGEGLTTVPGWWPIDILHFPLRSYAHFEAKVRNGGRAVARNPDPAFAPYLRELYRLYEAGRLPEYYADTLVHDDAVAAGIRDHRLVVDRRLQRWLRSQDPAAAAAEPASASDWEEPSGLEAQMLRAITVGEWHQTPALELERRLEKERVSHERTAGRLEKATATLKRTQAALAAEKMRPAQRLLRRIGALRRSGTSSGDRP